MSAAQDRPVHRQLQRLLAETVSAHRGGQRPGRNACKTAERLLPVMIETACRSPLHRAVKTQLNPPSFGGGRFGVFRLFAGKQRRQHLLGGVAVLMSIEVEFHTGIITEPGPKHNRKRARKTAG